MFWYVYQRVPLAAAALVQAVDRLAIAYSLAQSVRLSYWEQRIDQWVAATRTIPEDMANTGVAGALHCTPSLSRSFFSSKQKNTFFTAVHFLEVMSSDL